MSVVIYRATNLVNGKFYIGLTKRTLDWRRKKHETSAKRGDNASPKFERALRKYGFDKFSWSIEEKLELYAEALLAEVRLIADLRPEYNVTSGGQGWVGVRHTDEWKLKASQRKKLFNPGIAAARIVNARPITCVNDGFVCRSRAECVSRYGISSSQIKRVLNGSVPAAKGLVFLHGERVISEDDRRKILVEAMAECERRLRDKDDDKRLRVLCEDTGDSFRSITDAAKSFGVTQTAISRRIHLRDEFKSGPRFSLIGNRDGMAVPRQSAD